LQLPCPLCKLLFASSLELEQHVNRDHADILSPMTTTAKATTSKARSVSATSSTSSPRKKPKAAEQENGNECVSTDQECPVCEKRGFVNSNKLAEHIEEHFATPTSPAATATVTPSSTDRGQDMLLAQQLERQEREHLRHEEQRAFEALKAQYGMVDNDGNFSQQTISGMQKAVFKGEMSVVDYYERQVG
jgi:hypothetical protein